ncbi:signal transduction histidine kinase [Novosphingobium marinum]|uniref:histidine kinase n=1 Tax=Novosphingobium marinum TaxID=1514948 RepID=A0A7Y9Y0P1_9SPHN|nr:HWE histidine kinase domain-containing protein [Novosphingobium marinum]NYH96825.1 light-regulated signal transduction histidine kinase (bacteriophytochrome) [Novosphingobium marinum]GGC39952.1 signal transduction histidine kinase [Novosphingobium marinum]
MTDNRPPVDLSTCDMEPIHIIGRIQSFGYLLSFSSDWIVNHASANCADLFARDIRDLIGTPAFDVLHGPALHEIRSRLQMLGSPDSVERIFELDLLGDDRLFDIAVHLSGRTYILEAEPSETGRRRDYVSYVRPMIDRIRQGSSIQQLCDRAARQLRGLTGFDRVMVYRFAPGGAGEVISESINGSVDSFHGLHFPASDIPAQARRLYSRNILRIISDVDDPTVDILPQLNPSGDPLDLSMCGLRAVSPIHIEYLKNMGVKASMSVSIMRRGELWGLMACHHYSPLNLPYSVRTAAELFGEFFSYLLDQAETAGALKQRQSAMRLHDEIMARVAGGDTLLEAFEEFAGSIGNVIPFDGIVGWVDGEFMSRGSTPQRQDFERLARFLNTAGASTVWASDNLQSIYPDAARFADDAAGLLAIPVSRTPRDYIVLFRKEHVHSVSWAGNPEKSVELGPNGDRLTPRKSFDIWKEERRGFSVNWTRDEIESAESLRVTLLEVVLRLTDSVNQERERASKRQDILIAELNHRVRNILNLIRSLVTQSKASSNSIDEFAEIVGSRIYSLARAHDQVTQSDWSPSSLVELIRTECEAYTGGKADRVEITGTDALIHPGAFAQLALVIHELMTNSTKYGALSDSGGRVEVAIGKNRDDALELSWTERDGPPVKAPKSRGFGSTIIERTIPHELGGEARIDFDPEGLHARFVLPPDHVAAFQSLPDRTQESGSVHQAPGQEKDVMLSGDCLIVEDNMIIAMEAEDILGELGCGHCHVAGSVRDALKVIEDNDIRFALLDINLGRETSEEVAFKLARLGISFVFASGYGELKSRPEEFAKVPVITKPYAMKDIRSAIEKLGRR